MPNGLEQTGNPKLSPFAREIYIALITERKQRSLCEMTIEERREYFRKLASMAVDAANMYLETVE